MSDGDEQQMVDAFADYLKPVHITGTFEMSTTDRRIARRHARRSGRPLESRGTHPRRYRVGEVMVPFAIGMKPQRMGAADGLMSGGALTVTPPCVACGGQTVVVHVANGFELHCNACALHNLTHTTASPMVMNEPDGSKAKSIGHRHGYRYWVKA